MPRSLPIQRLLSPPRSGLYQTLAVLGMAFSLALVLTATQVQHRLQSLLDDGGQSEYLVISKRVAITHMLKLASTSFTEAELAALKAQPFVHDVGAFAASRFRLRTDEGGQLMLMTELSVESVPDRFLDVTPASWQWQDGDVIPALMSSEFLNFYNFVFAPSQGLPAISRGAATLMPIPVVLSGPTEEVRMTAKVVGVSDRMPSIIVPESFLKWANQRFAADRAPNVTRVIISVTDPGDPDLARFLTAKGYETNNERLRESRVALLVRSALLLTQSIGVLIFALAVLILTLCGQLLIAQSRDALRLLYDLGYRPAAVAWPLTFRFLLLMVSAVGLAVAVVACFVNTGNEWLLTNGLPTLAPWAWSSCQLASWIVVLAAAIHVGVLWLSLARLARVGKSSL